MMYGLETVPKGWVRGGRDTDAEKLKLDKGFWT